jgi:hypothetical protein
MMCMDFPNRTRRMHYLAQNSDKRRREMTLRGLDRLKVLLLIQLNLCLWLAPAWAARRHSHGSASSSGGGGTVLDYWMTHMDPGVLALIMTAVIALVFFLWHASFKDCKCKCGLSCKCKCRCSASCPCSKQASQSKGKFEM